MNERTQSYLRGRFGDYYRRHEPTAPAEGRQSSAPPAVADREWAHIPFTRSASTTMIRHEAILDATHLGDFLEQTKPRHVYHSAALYAEPGANTMGAKGWRGADLVFDLDADHLPGVDPDRDEMRDMLAACRTETIELIEMLELDFGFDDLTIVFSGNRGYHVHVRDEGVHSLDRAARREVVEYIRGEGLSFDSLMTTEAVAGGMGTTTKRRFHTDRGWGQRVVERLISYLEPLRDLPRDETIEYLATFPELGPSRAESVARMVDSRWTAIERGDLDLHPDFVRFVRAFLEHEVQGSGPAIDEPVTTDVHRLIRLPGSLHGATGLVVCPIDRRTLDTFEPLEAAVAPMFDQVDISIEVTRPIVTHVGGEHRRLDPGIHTVPEYVGIYLMAGGSAEKVQE